MKTPSSNSIVELAQKLMYNVAAHHTTLDSQRLTSIELYPLKDRPSTQLIPKLYKSHIQGILFKLGILKSHGKQIRIQSGKIQAFNIKCNDSPFELVSNKRGKPSYNTVELVVKTRELDIDNFTILTGDEKKEICSIREEYLSFVNTLGEEEETPEPMEVVEEAEAPETVQVENSSKRPRSVSDDEHSKPKTRKVIIAMRRSSVQVDIPKDHNVITKYKQKQLQNKANEVEAIEKENSKLKAKNAELELKNKEIAEIITAIGKRLTVTKDMSREIDQGKYLVSELSRKVKELQSRCETLHHSIRERDKKIAKLENEIEKNREATVIGKKMLRLPTRKKCPATPEGLRLYALMCSNLPGGSFKNFQQAIAIRVAAFFADNGLGSHYDSLEFIPHLTPSNKTLDQAVLIHEQFVLCKVANYFNKGAVASACHDKGNRAGLGRLILILAFYNNSKRYDDNWHDGIISLTLNCDGVKSKDVNIADHINKKLQRLRPYMLPDAKIQLSSATTDAGGGGGTKENCMLELEKKNPNLMYSLTYVLCCLLHVHNLPLQQSWEKHFGPFGIDKNTMSQCAYNVTYLFELLGESFKPLWMEIIHEDWNDLKLLKVILTRWLYAIQSVSKIFEKYEKIKKFCKAIYEAKKSTYLAHKVAKETYQLLDNPQVRVMMSFVKAFGEFYWTPFYNWARRKGSKTKTEGHIANEVIIQIFNAERTLLKLENRKWLEVDKFAECKRLRDELTSDQLTAVDQCFDGFLSEYIEIAFRDSCFGRWTSKTLVFGIASENKRSAQILTNYLLHKRDNTPLLDVTDEISEKTEIHMRYKEKEFQEFLFRRCKPIKDDPILVKHHEALKEMNEGASLYEERNVSDNMKKLQQTRDDVILTAKAHSHEAELGVQKIAHNMSAVNRSEMAGTAMSVAQSFDHQIVTSKHTEILQNRELKGNQHTKRGKAGERESISEESKRKAKEREGTTLQDLPRSQAGREKASLFIKQAENDPYPDGILFETMKRLARETKRMKQSKSDRIAIDVATHREEYAINQLRKQGLRRGKFRDGDALQATELDETESNKEGMKLADWKRKCQMRLLMEEICYATYPGQELEQSQKRSVLKSKLERIKTLTALKIQYARAWHLPAEECKQSKSIVINLLSPTCLGLGDSRVRTWDTADEEDYLMNGSEFEEDEEIES